jgi:hypothetical protein
MDDGNSDDGDDDGGDDEGGVMPSSTRSLN